MNSAAGARSEGLAIHLSWSWSFMFRKLIRSRDNLRSESQVMHRQANQAADHRQVAYPFQRMLPKLDAPRNRGILRQAAIDFRIGCVVQDVDHVRSADTGRIVDAGIPEPRNLTKLFCAALGKILHIV